MVQSIKDSAREKVGSQQARFIRAGLRHATHVSIGGSPTGELIRSADVGILVALHWSATIGDCSAQR
jgi:hypothetical protein